MLWRSRDGDRTLTQCRRALLSSLLHFAARLRRLQRLSYREASPRMRAAPLGRLRRRQGATSHETINVAGCPCPGAGCYRLRTDPPVGTCPLLTGPPMALATCRRQTDLLVDSCSCLPQEQGCSALPLDCPAQERQGTQWSHRFRPPGSTRSEVQARSRTQARHYDSWRSPLGRRGRRSRPHPGGVRPH